jgi:pilus assembly protein Flp/PilA
MTRIVTKIGLSSCLELARAFACDRRGATAIEYALIAAGLSMAIAAVVPQIATSVAGMFNQVNEGF